MFIFLPFGYVEAVAIEDASKNVRLVMYKRGTVGYLVSHAVEERCRGKTRSNRLPCYHVHQLAHRHFPMHGLSLQNYKCV